MTIDIWPNEPFSYWCRGHHSMAYFRQQLRCKWGVHAPYPVGKFEICHAVMVDDAVIPCYQPLEDSFPIMIWRAI